MCISGFDKDSYVQNSCFGERGSLKGGCVHKVHAFQVAIGLQFDVRMVGVKNLNKVV